jgi:hypothetical protein
MALWALENAPFSAVFLDFFDDFLRVLPRACARGRSWARMWPRNALAMIDRCPPPSWGRIKVGGRVIQHAPASLVTQPTLPHKG